MRKFKSFGDFFHHATKKEQLDVFTEAAIKSTNEQHEMAKKYDEKIDAEIRERLAKGETVHVSFMSAFTCEKCGKENTANVRCSCRGNSR